jgi:acyl-coenzyme A synthetase/AMP-(fatty) acid ligase
MILHDIYRHALSRPDHLAVVNSGVAFSYRRFAGMIEAVRNHLAAQPMPAKGIVAIAGHSLIYTWVLQLAVRALGYTTVKAPSQAVLESLELRNLSAVVGFDGPPDGWNPDTVGLWVPAAVLSQADTIALGDGIAGPPFGDHIVLTSGTTGNYKKIVQATETFDERMRYDRDAGIAHQPGDVVHMLSIAEWTIAGFLVPHRVWGAGATVIFDQRENWLDHFFDYPIDAVILVGAAIPALYGCAVRQPENYPELKIRMGGGFVLEKHLQNFLNKFNCRLWNSYSGTEFCIALFSSCKNVEDFLWLRPTLGNMLEIVDDDGRPVPDNVTGTVRVRLHPWDTNGYYDDPETTAQFYRGGYFYPGDMAVRRDDGRVRILGRVSDVLVVGGQKVAVRPHEERAQQVLGVDDVCLFARQDSSGAVILLVVVEGKELPARERREMLSAGYRDAFSDAKFATLSHFPRGENGMGKIDRQAVLALVDHLVT